MRTRRLAGYILFLVVAIPSAAQQPAAWWYPFGPPEATRRQSVVSTRDSIPVIRWRSAALRGTSLLLVGAARSESAAPGAQQIFGHTGDRIVVLESAGWTDTTIGATDLALPAGSAIRLTGLFNTAAPTPSPYGRPNTIGVGITRQQQVRDPYGLLLKPDFALRQELEIARLTSSNPQNLIVSIHPVAAYTPPGDTAAMAIAIVSQSSFVPNGNDVMINGVRRYTLNPASQEVDPRWRFVVAPRTLDHPSALTVDSSDGRALLALSTSAYTFPQPITASQLVPGQGARETSSNRGYAYLGDLRSPVIEQAIEIPPMPPALVVPSIPPAEVNSYHVRLFNGTSERPYRLVTEEHDRTRRGLPRLYLRLYNTGLPDDQQAAQIFTDSSGADLGWHIVQADLDGTDRSGPSKLRPSPGLEIVAMRRSLDGSALDSNRIFMFRGFDPARPGGPFNLWANQALRGRVLAAGDLVHDELGKDELVIADGPVVRVLRLMRLDDRRMGMEIPEYFDTLASYTLDAPVTEAVIADVENDGANDLVVATERATYLIGRPHPAPLGIVAVDRTEVCAGEPVVVTWHRAVGGGEEGMRVELIGIDRGDTTLLEAALAAPASAYTLDDGALGPGRYRLRISDPTVASIAAESPEIRVLPATIESFSVTPAEVGEVVTISTAVRCVDTVALEYSFPGPGAQWVRVPGRRAASDGVVTIDLPMPCPPDPVCGQSGDKVIQFRFTTTDGTTVSPVVSSSVRFAERTIVASPVAGVSRRQMIRWSESDYTCDSVRVSLSADNGRTWTETATAPRELERHEVDVPGELSQEILVRVCCDVGCGTGLGRFVVDEIGEADFVAPNPFDPTDADGGSTATIVYRLTTSGSVTITIYDVARAVVRRLVSGEEMSTGLKTSSWDGRNDAGEIVADGTYICLVTSSGGDRIALPLSVVKR